MVVEADENSLVTLLVEEVEISVMGVREDSSQVKLLEEEEED